MASNKTTAGADLAVDFNRVNLALAKRQSMLASLMGLSSAAKGPHNSVVEEVSDDFAAEPELCVWLKHAIGKTRLIAVILGWALARRNQMMTRI